MLCVCGCHSVFCYSVIVVDFLKLRYSLLLIGLQDVNMCVVLVYVKAWFTATNALYLQGKGAVLKTAITTGAYHSYQHLGRCLLWFCWIRFVTSFWHTIEWSKVGSHRDGKRQIESSLLTPSSKVGKSFRSHFGLLSLTWRLHLIQQTVWLYGNSYALYAASACIAKLWIS